MQWREAHCYRKLSMTLLQFPKIDIFFKKFETRVILKVFYNHVISKKVSMVDELNMILFD